MEFEYSAMFMTIENNYKKKKKIDFQIEKMKVLHFKDWNF